ncbi:MAG: hypothetical protein K2I77_01950, partial [Anaeroplasmataceae bacterium]|nr:hypothetical protein [Anaeroplasmataceae bacterium]
PKVIRVVIGYSGYVSFVDLNTYMDRRPPESSELPNEKLLIYGSSISHGSEALEYINSYAFLLSRLLHIDVINKAIPGSCLAEESMCHYLKELQADKAFVEFGVNVLGLYSLEEYKYHLDLLLSSICAKKLYFTSVLDNGHILEKDSLLDKMNSFRDYAKSIKKYQYIDPTVLLDDFSSLSADFLHPSDFGQMLIAWNLFKILKMNN